MFNSVSTPLFGVGGAVSTIDHQCETRNNAAIVVTALHDVPLARAILCEIKDVREAAARIGEPCVPDNPRAPPIAANDAASGAAAPQGTATTTTAAVEPLRPGAPRFCYTPGLAINLYPQCSLHPAPLPAVESRRDARAGRDRHVADQYASQ